MEGSDHHNHHHDDIWVESDTYQPHDVHENKKGTKKDQLIRVVVILSLILLLMFLWWLKN